MSQIWGAGERYLRAAYQSWFDVLLIAKGKIQLESLDDVHAISEKDPSLFGPALDGKFEPIPLPAELIESGRSVDAQFPTMWTGLEQGLIDAEPDLWRREPALRITDGSYWQVHDEGSVVRARRTKPKLLAWSLRSRLWEGASPRTRELSPSLRARVERAVSLEAILNAPVVEVEVHIPDVESPTFLLEGTTAFRWEDTGEEERSLDWTNPWPEPVLAFVPCSRDEVLKTLCAETTIVTNVDYAHSHRRKHGV